MSQMRKYAICPYNPSHVVLRKRLAGHLVKCSKQHLSSGFKICPFNFTHHMPEDDLEGHVLICPDRRGLDNFIYNVGEVRPYQVPNDIQLPDAQENWDMDFQQFTYLDCKDMYLEDKLIARQPVGLTKAEKKAFYKKETLRFARILRNMQSEIGEQSASSEIQPSATNKKECGTSSKE